MVLVFQTMGDADGMDGQYGKGNVTISRGDTGEVLWFADGTRIASEVHLTMADNGDLVSLANTTAEDDFFSFDDDFTFDDDVFNIDDDEVFWETYTEKFNLTDDDLFITSFNDTFDDDSWDIFNVTDFDPAMESDWPGRFPEDTNTVVFNIKTDDYPEEMSWTWSRLEGGKWQILSKEQPPEDSNNTLLSTESPSLVPGSIYRVMVVDSFADGAFGYHEGSGKGWFSLTNASIPEDGETKGTIMWAAIGYEYTKELEVYFAVDNEGNVEHVVPVEGGSYAAPKQLVDEEEDVMEEEEEDLEEEDVMEEEEEAIMEENEENIQISVPVEDSEDPVARNEAGSFP